MRIECNAPRAGRERVDVETCALIPEFEPPAREAWLALVEKVLKGADFEKRLVSRTADGLAVQPLYTRADAVEGARLTARTAYFPGGWDIRQRHAEPDAEAANAAILDDLTGGATSLILQIPRPARPVSPTAPRHSRRPWRACSSTAAPSRSMRARTPWMPPAA